ncbi:MAG: cytochrome P460 family protein [Candidatus Poribacteria bacterium]|nr:cytochrome P460 family protein [Candidatus Poribacteria bacterium]
MLKFQITLIAILIGCMAFVACERTQDVLEDVMMDPEPGTMEMDAYKSWENRMLDGPWLDFKGDAHDLGARTIYLNEAAAMANKAGMAYPVGSMIVKVSMDTTNTFVSQFSTMTKTDSADNGGWEYGVTGPPSATAVDMMMINTLTSEMAAGACVGCHANASNDFVFVPLSMMTDDDTEGGETGDNGDETGGNGGA